ncbi:AraC family transcriptional regulator [Paenibacillus sp. GYB003]|uniref:AraC family transcriptional regulator n=1 Tax=Paenibacillus sp. GYB003 TaxID=2994392 RepID=UPI002F9692B5
MPHQGALPDLSLTFAGADEWRVGSRGIAEMPECGDPAFVFVAKGGAKAALLESGATAPTEGEVRSGDVWYVPPAARCTVEIAEGAAFHAIWLRFACGEAALSAIAGESLPKTGSGLLVARLPQARSWFEAFPACGGKPGPALLYKLQSHLYAIASAFLNDRGNRQTADDRLLDYVERAKRHLIDHYGAQADVNELARQSGASPGRFYDAFRTQTGLSPLQYVTAIRLNAALKQLAQPGASVAEVAHSVGYADELYFSKLFRKQMGMSPTEFAARARKKIVMQPIFKGDLSVLGIPADWILERGWWNDPEPHIRKIADTRPELVLTSPIPGNLLREVARLAPIVSLEWKGYPWKKRLRHMSDMLGVAAVAERWLAFYDRKVDNARRLVRRHLGETPFLLVSAFGSGYRVYGMRMNKIKDLFYDDLGVTPPAEAHGFGLLEVEALDDAAAIPCDNALLLLPLSRTPDEIAACERRWRKLKSGSAQARCLIVRYEEPLMYNAETYDSLIDQTVRLLTAK